MTPDSQSVVKTKTSNMTTNAMDSCKAEIIHQIEKSLRKGLVEGILFNPCSDCKDMMQIKISVPLTHISISGSGVKWKAQGYASSKLRK
jgi:hypothetical protein